MLQANDVSVEINNKTILENIKFDVPAGKITALIGPNGSGKSTLMRAISGEISYQGKIFINEHGTRPKNMVNAAKELINKYSVFFNFSVSTGVSVFSIVAIHIGLR